MATASWFVEGTVERHKLVAHSAQKAFQSPGRTLPESSGKETDAPRLRFLATVAYTPLIIGRTWSWAPPTIDATYMYMYDGGGADSA